MGPQRLDPHVPVLGDRHLRGQQVVTGRALEPPVVVRRVDPQLQELGVPAGDPGPRPHRVVQLGWLPGWTRLRVPTGISCGVEGRHRHVVHLHVVGVVVLAPGVRVGDDDLGSDPPDDRHQATDGLVRVGVGERPRVGVGFRLLHSGVPVAEHHDLVVSDDRRCPGQLGLPDRSQVATDVGPVHLRVQDVARLAAGAAHQHAVHSLGVQAGDRRRSLRGLVVRVGVDRQQAQWGIRGNCWHDPKPYPHSRWHHVRRGHHCRPP